MFKRIIGRIPLSTVRKFSTSNLDFNKGYDGPGTNHKTLFDIRFKARQQRDIFQRKYENSLSDLNHCNYVFAVSNLAMPLVNSEYSSLMKVCVLSFGVSMWVFVHDKISEKLQKNIVNLSTWKRILDLTYDLNQEYLSRESLELLNKEYKKALVTS